TPSRPAVSAPAVGAVEVTDSRVAQVGSFPVRRGLPRQARRSIGAWCFADQMGPALVTPEHGLDVAPHPHIGLQTVTWMFEGDAVHRDSIGTEQLIVPGELNLMTAGHGVAHSEEGTGHTRGVLHGMQLWVAQPSATRDGPPAFEHHAELPRLDLDNAVATVLAGGLAGATSPARSDSDLVGADLELRPGITAVPLRADFEHALVVCVGTVTAAGHEVGPGQLACLGLRRSEIALSVVMPTRVMLLGGAPFDEPLVMWWNYVARNGKEIVAAHAEWASGSERFGRVASVLPRIVAPAPPWR
ncbi:MAG: pirin family protein, partial [Acidimicrobiales bacterium]